MNFDFEKIDSARLACGFLTIAETMEVLDGNLLLDPFSTLISSNVNFGRNNVIYPGVTLQATQDAEIILGDGNILHSGTHISASHGDVVIANGNQFGEGGFTARANRPGAKIKIGSDGRYLNNPSVFGATKLGDGTQILGAITVDSCSLGDGASYKHPDPDDRGGLLKGFGTAKNLTVPQGHVVAGQGAFEPTELVSQRYFHPKD